MDTVELLKQFADPAVIKSLSLGQRVLAGLFTTILGMGITFISLIILQFITALFPKLNLQRKRPQVVAPVQKVAIPKESPAVAEEGVQKEIIAAITVALSLQLETPASNIVIRNIRRVGNPSPVWSTIGLTEEMERFLN